MPFCPVTLAEEPKAEPNVFCTFVPLPIASVSPYPCVAEPIVAPRPIATVFVFAPPFAIAELPIAIEDCEIAFALLPTAVANSAVARVPRPNATVKSPVA